MLQKRSVAVFCLTLACIPARAASEDFLLTHGQLQKLSSESQTKYLRGVQTVFAHLSEISGSFAAEDKKSRDVANETVYVPAEGIAAMLKNAEDWMGKGATASVFADQKKLADYKKNFEQSVYWTAAAQEYIVEVPEDDPAKKDLNSRLQKLQVSITEQRTAHPVDLKVEKAYGAFTKTNDGKKGVIPNETLIDFESKKVINLEAGPAKAPEAPAAEVKAPEAPPAPVEPKESVARTPTLRGYRCMYAGFVLQKDPCAAPTKLPDNVKLDAIDSEKMVCKAGQALCNPLLFGVKIDCDFKDKDFKGAKIVSCLKEARPICVSHNRDATLSCASKAGSEKDLQSTVLVIMANPQAWEDYRTSFYELCDDKMIAMNEFSGVRAGKRRRDPKKTMEDIERTCANAKAQLKKLKDQFEPLKDGRPDKKAAPAKPSEGEK